LPILGHDPKISSSTTWQLWFGHDVHCSTLSLNLYISKASAAVPADDFQIPQHRQALSVISHFMKALILHTILVILTVPAISQTRYAFDASKQPYILVDTFRVDIKLLVISPDNIETVDVLKDSNAVKMYGDKATYGAVIIKTKPNAKLLRANDILNNYNISQADKNLRICINKTIITRPELLLIEQSEILGVEITMDEHWIYPEDANSTERFINIKTVVRKKNGL
jgi:hypothetical protein